VTDVRLECIGLFYPHSLLQPFVQSAVENVDSFFATSTVGEFAARLDIVRAFTVQARCVYFLCAQVNCVLTRVSVSASMSSSRRRLANALQHLVGLYEESLPAVQRAKQALREPISKKLLVRCVLYF
jgi:hypothetical protein